MQTRYTGPQPAQRFVASWRKDTDLTYESKRVAPVFVVSGLPRSGTSMMMRMLDAGGLPALTDGVRPSDQDNPDGYYEFEPVKTLEHNASWIDEARGRVIKIVYVHLRHLPASVNYKIIFMRRIIEEIIASRDEMLRRAGMPVSRIGQTRWSAYFDQELRETERWLIKQSNFEVLYVDYNQTVADAAHACHLVKNFLCLDLEIERMQSIATRTLYRQRISEGARCARWEQGHE
jgi:hypothetical protein